MNSRDLARYLVLGGVVAGLSAGTSLRADQAKSAAAGLNQATSQAVQMADEKKAGDKHACKGLNGCKGQGAGGKNECVHANFRDDSRLTSARQFNRGQGVAPPTTAARKRRCSAAIRCESVIFARVLLSVI